MPPPHQPTTIYALASGRPPAAIAVIRLSGSATREVLASLGAARALDAPRRMVRAALRDATDEILDDAIVAWFPGPESYTGEDAAELYLHGGRTTVDAVFRTLEAIDGVSMADPGAFSRRAFDNGKLDLAEIEGLADLIAAETEAQRRQALRQLSGVLGRACDVWRDRLIHSLAHMEATIDFSDEDLPDALDSSARAEIEGVCDEIETVLADGHAGERLRDGLVVAIVGAPNAGKSTLLNALAGRDAAIVSEYAGTTRDIIEVAAEIGGYPVSLIDTAGLRDSDDPIETEGIRRARAAAGDADLRFVLIDGAGWPAIDAEAATLLEAPGAIGIVSKADLDPVPHTPETPGVDLIAVSATTGAGMDALEARLRSAAADAFGGADGALITRARHREALGQARDGLRRALDAQGAELWAEDLRFSLAALGRIAGRVDVEDLLDIIFSEFCIGK